MRVAYDFWDGPIATRFVDAIKRNCSVAEIMELRHTKKIRDIPEMLINYRCLKAEYVSDYCRLTIRPASYFFYGTTDFVSPGITEADDEILSMLDSWPYESKQNLFDFIQRFYPNKFFYQFAEKSTPSKRLVAYIKTNSLYGAVSPDAGDWNPNVSQELIEEFKRFRASGHSKSFVFNSNLWPELAQYAGVSLHWLFNLEVPMYGHSQLSDLIFDYYTLMQPEEKASFFEFLKQVQVYSGTLNGLYTNKNSYMMESCGVPMHEGYPKSAEKLLNFEELKARFRKEGNSSFQRWVADNSDAIKQEIVERVVTIYESGVPFCPANENLANYISLPSPLGKDRNRFALSHITRAGCGYEDQSCHKVLFGETIPIILEGRTESVICSIREMDMRQYEELLCYLQAHPLATNNPAIVFQKRCQEVSWRNGKPSKKGISISVRGSGRVIATKFFEDDHPLEAQLRGRVSFQTSTVAMKLLLTGCAQYNLSVDYFLNLDYSNLALWRDGRSVSVMEHDFLSAYLCATDQAQERVVQQIGFYLMGLNIPICLDTPEKQ